MWPVVALKVAGPTIVDDRYCHMLREVAYWNEFAMQPACCDMFNARIRGPVSYIHPASMISTRRAHGCARYEGAPPNVLARASLRSQTKS